RTSSSDALLSATSEIATRAVLPTPPALAVKLFDWREPLYMNTRSGGTPARPAISTTASRTWPGGTGSYLLNNGSTRTGETRKTNARPTAVRAPDHSHHAFPARRISQ